MNVFPMYKNQNRTPAIPPCIEHDVNFLSESTFLALLNDFFLLKVQCKEDFSQANFIFPFARRKAMEPSISNHCKYALQQQQTSV